MSVQNLNGVDMGNGVQRVEFFLTPYSPLEEGITPPPPSTIGIYVTVPAIGAPESPNLTAVARGRKCFPWRRTVNSK
jgi:hypothetical protein